MEYSRRNVRKLLLYAICADTPEKRVELFNRVEQRTGLSRRHLYRKLARMGVHSLHPPPYLGPEAIALYETKFRLLLKIERIYSRVAAKLQGRIDYMQANVNRCVTVAEAAHILRVRKETVILWVRDLEVIQANTDGLVPLAELRRFMTSDARWLMPVVRLLPRKRKS